MIREEGLVGEPALGSEGRQTTRRLLRRTSVWLSGGFLGLIVALSVAAPLVAPFNPEESNFTALLERPSWAHLLGTDDLGRDVLSRVLYGGRVTLLGAAEAVLIFVAIGLPLGLIAGYLHSRVDRIVMMLTDVLQSLPVIILLLVTGALFSGDFALMLTLGVVASPSIVRVVRGATLSVRSELYVKAAELSGLSKLQILKRHILPQIARPALVQVSVFAAAAVVIESTLGFLGLDVNPPSPSWGSMIAEGATQINQQPWLIVPSGLVITLTVLAIGVLGDALREGTSRNTQSPSKSKRRNKGLAVTAEERISEPDDMGNRDTIRRSAPDALLEVTDLVIALTSKGSGDIIVDGANLTVSPGEAVGIVGESGSGKSLTILSILGLLPDGLRVSHGEVLFEGHDLLKLSKREIAAIRGRQIAFISQEPMLALDPSYTVGSQLREAIRANTSVSRKVARSRSLQLLADVELPDPLGVSRRFPHELSGGMAQRVCIALALTGEPKLLLADEPTTGLDVTVQADILDLLRTLRERYGMALVIVSHDWGVIADACDRTFVMYAGEVVEYAASEELFLSPRHPYTAGLLAANPHMLHDGPFPSIPGNVPMPSDWPVGCRFKPRCPYAQDDCGVGRVEMVILSESHSTRCLHSDFAREDQRVTL
jgi:peptide/nickel transport system permease protein